MAYGLQETSVKIIILRKVYMSKNNNSSVDSELLDVVNQYKNTVKINEISFQKRLNKELDDFANMWYAAFPEQLNETPYLAQKEKNLKNGIYKKKN